MPLVVIAPIWADPDWVNHIRPSGPATIPSGALDEPETGKSTVSPVTRVVSADPAGADLGEPESPVRSQGDLGWPCLRRLTGGRGWRGRRGRDFAVNTPPVVIRPIWFAFVVSSVNQMDPSGPAVIPAG